MSYTKAAGKTSKAGKPERARGSGRKQAQAAEQQAAEKADLLRRFREKTASGRQDDDEEQEKRHGS